jgi:hypothetical protein
MACVDASVGLYLKGAATDRCYAGDLIQARRNGFGAYRYPNSFYTYEGEYKDGRKHGTRPAAACDVTAVEGLTPYVLLPDRPWAPGYGRRHLL